MLHGADVQTGGWGGTWPPSVIDSRIGFGVLSAVETVADGDPVDAAVGLLDRLVAWAAWACACGLVLDEVVERHGLQAHVLLALLGVAAAPPGALPGSRPSDGLWGQAFFLAPLRPGRRR